MNKQQEKEKQEYLDVVNENGEVIGKDTRYNCHKNSKLLHKVCDVFLFNEKGEVLLQQRSADKINDPNMWTNSAGGHIESGESEEVGVAKEIKEEVGLKDVKLTKCFSTLTYVYRGDGGNESHFVNVYIGFIHSLCKLTKQDSEVQQLKWFNAKIVAQNNVKKDMSAEYSEVIMTFYNTAYKRYLYEKNINKITYQKL